MRTSGIEYGYGTVSPLRILYEAKPTRGLSHSVQPHDDPLDLPAHREQLVDLLLSGVEREVADVQRGGVSELLIILLFSQLEGRE